MYGRFSTQAPRRAASADAARASEMQQQVEGLACLIGLCASAEYRLATTEGWGQPALDILRETCVRIGAVIRNQGIVLQAPPAPPLLTIHGVVAQCVALNDFVMQIRRRCQNQLNALRESAGHAPAEAAEAPRGASAVRGAATASANHRWFRPEPGPNGARQPLVGSDLQQLRLAFQRIQRLLAHSGAEAADGSALARRVEQVMARLDGGHLDSHQLWSVLGQAQRTLAELGPRAETLAQAFAQVTHIVGHAHLRSSALAA